MASNTQILIKRSEANNTPGILNSGELAYSYASNTLFIGTPGSDGYVEIGHYSNLTNLTASTYGDATHIPIITVDSHGTVTNVTTSAISTTLSLSSDNGSNTMSLLDGTLTITGGDGITTSIVANTSEVVIDVDDTVFRSNTEGTITGTQKVQSDVEISGNLTVQGTTTYVNTAIYATTDSLIELAANNTTGDVVDIGFYGLHQNTSTSGVDVTGLVRNAGTSDYYLFDRVNIGDEANLDANTLAQAFTSANGASLYAHQFLAAQGDGSLGGFSFSGNEGGLDTGMFSPTDGQLEFYTNSDRAGQVGASNEGTSFGVRSAASNQGYRATAIGLEAGQTDQGNFAVAVGLHAGGASQQIAAVAVGHSAGQNTQGADAVAVGVAAGINNQGANATAIGNRAGAGYTTSQGEYAVAVGALAGYDSQAAYSIAINASGSNLNPTESGLYIDPIRANNATGGNVTVYNTSTKELVSTDVVINNSGITLANGTTISDGESGLFVDSLNNAETSNVVFYNTDTKELTYGSMADLRPDRIQSGSYYWEVDASTGALFSDAGTYIGDNANSVVIGQNIDLTNTNTNRVAIGNGAGQTNQSYGTVAIGEGAGNSNQNFLSVAVGLNAGNNNQSNSTVAVGHGAGYNFQGFDSVAVGVMAGKNSQGTVSVAIGNRAAQETQSNYAVAVGNYAGATQQGSGAVAIGDYAGENYLSSDAIAIGTYASQNSNNNNGWGTLAIGRYAGREYAGSQSVAIGSYAGNSSLGYHAIAIGHYAAYGGSGSQAIAIGDEAGDNAAQGSITMGYQAGYSASQYSVAIGYQAGWYDSSPLGLYQIAIGAYAAQNYGQDYSIVLNASGTDLSARSSGFFVNPVAYTVTQDATDDGIMFYNQTTKEIRYSYSLDGGSF